MSTTTIRRRPARSVPAVICAALLLGASSIAVWAGVTALSGDTRIIGAASAAVTASFSSQPTLIIAALTAVIGLLLIVIAATPGQYNAHLITPHSATRAAVRSKALEVLLSDTARMVDGVDTARTTVTNRKADVHIRTYMIDRGDLRTTVSQNLQRRIDTLNLTRAPRVSVSVSTHKN